MTKAIIVHHQRRDEGAMQAALAALEAAPIAPTGTCEMGA